MLTTRSLHRHLAVVAHVFESSMFCKSWNLLSFVAVFVPPSISSNDVSSTPTLKVASSRPAPRLTCHHLDDVETYFSRHLEDSMFLPSS